MIFQLLQWNSLRFQIFAKLCQIFLISPNGMYRASFFILQPIEKFLLIKCIRMGHKKRAPFSVAEETFSFQYSIL